MRYARRTGHGPQTVDDREIARATLPIDQQQLKRLGFGGLLEKSLEACGESWAKRIGREDHADRGTAHRARARRYFRRHREIALTQQESSKQRARGY